MSFTLSENVRKKCKDYDVHIHPNSRFGHEGATSFAVEGPADITEGTFDFDLLAGFSYIGDLDAPQGSFYRHVNLIGRFCSIAGGVSMGAAEHPTNWVSTHTIFYNGRRHWPQGCEFRDQNAWLNDAAGQRYVADVHDSHPKIVVGHDVWIGEGVFIRRGVTIGDGAILASHAVVTKDVPPYAIVGGVPAKILRFRFEPDIIEELLSLQWWDYGLSAMNGVNWTDIDMALWQMQRNITEGLAEPYSAPILQISENDVDVVELDRN